jgi:carboxyl-terminal processing protease
MLLLAGVAGGITLLNVAHTYSASSQNADFYRKLDLFGEVLELVRAKYVEKPDDEKLIESALNGMLSSLDPHSSYLSPKNYKEMQVQTSGEFGGLGVEISMENGIVKVVSPIDDTPAAKAGLQANDVITHVDKESLAGLTLDKAVEKMRGPVDSPVTLTILRKGSDAPFDVTLVRRLIRINPIKERDEGGRCLYQDQHFQRADPRQSRQGSRKCAEVDRRQAQGLHHRSSQRSWWPARPGDPGRR